MPLYTFKCGDCGSVQDDVLLHMVDIGTDAEPSCCGARMTQVLHVPMATVQGECHYVCPKTGEKITSRKQRAENFARNGLMDANDFTPDYLHREQMKVWGPIREKAKAHEETNKRITGGGVGLDSLIPADAGA